jgi:adenylylsulfate kinase
MSFCATFSVIAGQRRDKEPREEDSGVIVEHEGFTLWFTGMSGAGKSTLSERVVARLREGGAKVELLDGDIVRTNLSQGLGFSREDRDTNIRRIGFVAELLSRNGVIAIVAAISPWRETREEVKGRIRNFVEVFVDAPLEVLAQRDVKGLYKRALAGEVDRFTGVSDPYEPPLSPDVVVRSDSESIEDGAEKVWRELQRRGLVRERS